MKHGFGFRFLSAFLALSLVWLDFAWATDVRQALLDAKKAFDTWDEDRRNGISFQQLQTQSQTNESEVSEQETLQDLEKLNFNLTTPNGDIIQYLGNKIDHITRPDGTVLKNVSVDSEGRIAQADLRLDDGSILIFSEGKVSGLRTPDGTRVVYEAGLVKSTLSSQGLETIYSYERNAQGVILRTILENDKFKGFYDAEGRILQAISKVDDVTTDFSDGMIRQITLASGKKLLFKRAEEGDSDRITFDVLVDSDQNRHRYDSEGRLTEITLSNDWKLSNLIISSDGTHLVDFALYDDQGLLVSNSGAVTHPQLTNLSLSAWSSFGSHIPFVYALYSRAGVLREVLNPDDIILKFDAKGLLQSAVDSDGNETTFSFEESSLSNILGARIVKGDLNTRYDEEGRLKSIEFQDWMIHYQKGSDTIDFIQKSDGTELYDLVFDDDGVITGATIIDPEGNTRMYEDGELLRYIGADEAEYDFLDGKLLKLTTPDDLIYKFEYTPQEITAKLDSSIIPDVMTAVEMRYDTDFSLKTMIRKNQEILSFFRSDLVRIDYPEDAPQEYAYEKDSSGKILKTIVTQANIQTVYDEFNQPVESVISSTAQNPHELKVSYKYGKIREVTKDGVLILKYSYSFTPDGKERSEIEDLEENALKIYQDSQLLTSFQKDTSVLSAYSYAGDKVAKVQVTRFGRALHTYDYSYEGEYTLVKDEENVTRTYSAGKKLLFLQREDKTYSYSYANDPQGKEIVEEMLYKRRLKDGSTAIYDHAKISKVERPDGSYLTDIVLNDDFTFKQGMITLPDQTKKIFTKDAILEEISADGTHFYFDGNRLQKVLTPQAQEILYEYVFRPNSSSVVYERSGTQKTVTFKGDAKSDPASVLGASSLSFDGAGDYLEIPDSDDWTFGAGEFTIDFWMNLKSLNTPQVLLSQWQDASNNWEIRIGNGNTLEFTSRKGLFNFAKSFTPQANKWYHVAFQRKGSNFEIYLDGTLMGQKSMSGISLLNVAGKLFVGQFGDGTLSYKGNLEDLRVSKGIARYTSAGFTPPKAAQMTDAKTKLLLQSGDNKEIIDFVDVTQGGVKTRYAASDLSAVPYIAKTNVTLDLAAGVKGVYRFGELAEVWENNTLVYTYSSWNLNNKRETFVEKSGTLYKFDDQGTLSGFWLDNYFYSLQSELKVFEDEAAVRHRPNFHGNAKLDSVNTRFGKTTMLFDGDGDYLSFADSADWTFGTGDWTMDFQIRFNSLTTPQDILSQYYDNGNHWDFRFGNGSVLEFQSKQGYAYAFKNFYPQTGAWYHIAVQRRGTLLEFYVDGVLQIQANVAGLNMVNIPAKLYVGQWGQQSNFLNANLADLRISKKALFTGNFTPPASSVTPASSTVLLYHEYLKAYAGKAYQSQNGYVILSDEGKVTDYSLAQIQSQAASFLSSTLSVNKELPYENSLVALDFLNPQRSSWQDTAEDSLLKLDELAIQEYSSDGALETQTKGDQTVTLFDNNKPTEVQDATGRTLILYSYDEAGNLKSVVLKNARSALPEEVQKAKTAILEEKQKELLRLAQAKQLAIEDIRSQADAARSQLRGQINQIQGSLSDIEGQKAKGKQAKRAKADAMSQVEGVLGQAWSQWDSLNRQEADAYASLDAEIYVLSGKIEEDSQKAFTELAKQEKELKKEILRQEISPIVYDHYRRILGRDPSQAEYDSWIDKIDYETGEVILSETVHEIFQPGTSSVFTGQDYLSVPDSTSWNFGGADFTIDLWAKWDSLSSDQGLLEQSTWGNNGWKLMKYGSEIDFMLDGSHLIRTSGAGLAVGAWTHIALTRQGNSWKIFINGREKAQVTDSRVISDYSYALLVGTLNDGGIKYGFKGRLDELRISKGIARWTSDFDPFTHAYLADAPTQFLLREKIGTAGFFDASASNYAISIVGQPAVDAAQYKVEERGYYTTYQTAPLSQVLTTHLESLPELAERRAYVESIKTQVRDLVASYLGKTDAQKEAFTASLGLAKEELIPLSQSDAQKILVWLDTRSLHFGQSAFLSLESLLDQKGIHYAREDIAVKAILVDILAGVITPLDDGDLILSIFALNKTAKIYGVELLGAHLTWEDLQSVIPAEAGTGTARAIAHINGNHFVVITAITADSITYIDMGIGKDKSNESITVTKEGFLKVWKGDVTLEKSRTTQIENIAAKTLSAVQTKEIRGAFFGSILNLIGFAITVFSAGVLTPLAIAMYSLGAVVSVIEGDFISAISSILTLGFGGALGFLGDFFKGALPMLSGLIDGVGYVFSSIFSAVTGFFEPITKTLGGFFTNAFGATGAKLAWTAVGIGLNFGVAKGLEILGVSPVIAGYMGAVITGVVVGASSKLNDVQIAKGVSHADVVRTNVLQTVILNDVGTLGLELGLDPSLIQMAGLSLATIQGTAIQSAGTSLTEAFAQIKRSLVTSFSQYGFEKLGTRLGFDPRVSSLIGAPISAAVTTGFTAGKNVGESMIAAIREGALRGATNATLQHINNEFGLDPLVSALTVNAVTGGVLGVLNQDGNFIKGVARSFKESTLNFLSFGSANIDPSDPSYSYQQAIYLSNIKNFAEIVRSQGLEQALGAHIADIFTSESVENICKRGGISDFLINDASSIQIDGKVVTKVRIDEKSEMYLDPTTDDLVGRKYANILESSARYGFDQYGNFGMLDGKRTISDAGGLETTQFIKDGKLIHLLIEGQAPLIEMHAINEEVGIIFENDQTFTGVEIGDHTSSVTIKIYSKDHVEIFKEAGDYEDPIRIERQNGEINFYTPVNKEAITADQKASYLSQLLPDTKRLVLDEAVNINDYNTLIGNLNAGFGILQDDISESFFDSVLEWGKTKLDQQLINKAFEYASDGSVFLSNLSDVLDIADIFLNPVLPVRDISDFNKAAIVSVMNKFKEYMDADEYAERLFAHRAIKYDPNLTEQAVNAVMENLYQSVPVIGNFNIGMPKPGEVDHYIAFQTIDKFGWIRRGTLQFSYGKFTSNNGRVYDAPVQVRLIVNRSSQQLVQEDFDTIPETDSGWVPILQ